MCVNIYVLYYLYIAHSKNKTFESLQQIKNSFAASIDQKMTPISSPIAGNTQS